MVQLTKPDKFHKTQSSSNKININGKLRKQYEPRVEELLPKRVFDEASDFGTLEDRFEP